MDIWFAALLGSLAGIIGTGAGGILSFVIPSPNKRAQSALLRFTGGMMIAVVCFELLPEAFALHSIAMGIGSMAVGVAFVVLLDGLLSSMAGMQGPYKAGAMMLIGIAIHNFPEGLAIGSGYASAPQLGLGLCALIALHDVPEGIAVGIPMRQGKIGVLRVGAYAALSGAPTGLGALLGYCVGGISSAMISASMGVAAGAMLYLVFSEMIPQADNLHRGPANGVALCLGIALGILAVVVI